MRIPSSAVCGTSSKSPQCVPNDKTDGVLVYQKEAGDVWFETQLSAVKDMQGVKAAWPVSPPPRERPTASPPTSSSVPRRDLIRARNACCSPASRPTPRDLHRIRQPGPEVIGNPYPGLRPFERDDAHLFFGREKPVKELVSLLARHRFLAVVGVSGTGKSSLVKAGLLPALHLGAMGEEFPDWRVAVMTPAGDPLEELCRALSSGKALGPDPDCRALLESTSRGLIERTLRAGLEDGAHLRSWWISSRKSSATGKIAPRGRNSRPDSSACCWRRRRKKRSGRASTYSSPCVRTFWVSARSSTISPKP